MPATAFYALVMFLAGIGIPILAALNAALGARLGSPAVAAMVLFTVALTAVTLVALVTGLGPARALPAQPKHLFLAGLFVAFYVIAVTYIAPHFGVGNAVFFVLLGQIVSAAAIDHFGLFGASLVALSTARIVGILMMAAGIALTQKW